MAFVSSPDSKQKRWAKSFVSEEEASRPSETLRQRKTQKEGEEELLSTRAVSGSFDSPAKKARPGPRPAPKSATLGDLALLLFFLMVLYVLVTLGPEAKRLWFVYLSEARERAKEYKAWREGGL